MATDIRLPNLGENVKSGDVLSILVSEGDEIQADQGVLELETEKATLEVPSPTAGRVTRIHVSEGDTVPVGAVILTVEASAAGAKSPAKPAVEPAKPAPESAKAAPKQSASPREEAPERPAPTPQRRRDDRPAEKGPVEKAPPQPAAEAATAPTAVESKPAAEGPGDGQAGAPAGPAVRRLARELGVDLRRVRPTGAAGRITREDVQAFVRTANERAAKTTSGPPLPGAPATDAFGPIRREKMSRMRQTIARTMVESYTTIPQLTNFDDADVTELEKIRLESKDDYAKSGVKLTAMPFLIKSIASALRQHPVINASVDVENQQIIYKEYVNIGVAVDTERGLLVPVIRDADRLSIPQIAHALAELGEKARAGKTTLDDLRGGTFSISNLGAIGGTYSTPIINPPEVAIVLAGRARQMPIYVSGHLVPRLMLPLSMTYDHRIVDGATATRFLNDVKGYLSAPGRLLLAP
jgi:pyruvate dehydrogenase E2 component (dihydrolipoamide acetyltransferase)